MTRPFDDALFATVCPAAAPAVVTVAATPAWTPVPTSLPPGVDRYRLQIAPTTVAYELRFRSDAPTGFPVPAGVLYTHPDLLAAGVHAEVRTPSGAAPVVALVGYPDPG